MVDPIPREELDRRLEKSHIVERQWKRKDVAFSVYAPREPDSGPKLFVKEPPDWQAENAEAAFSMHARCREAAAHRGEPHFVGKPHSWGASPPFLCVEWIGGQDLREFIAERLARDGASAWLSDVLTAAGALMALYHQAVTNWPERADHAPLPGPSDRVTSRVSAAARRLAGPAATPAEVTVRGFRDASAGNIIIDEDGRLWLIDLPNRIEGRAVQWDAALIAYRLVRAVDRATRRLPGRLGISYRMLLEAVRVGHASKMPGVVGSDQSVGLFYAYVAAESANRFVNTAFKKKMTLLALTGRLAGWSLVAAGRARWSGRGSEESPQRSDEAGTIER